MDTRVLLMTCKTVVKLRQSHNMQSKSCCSIHCAMLIIERLNPSMIEKAFTRYRRLLGSFYPFIFSSYGSFSLVKAAQKSTWSEERAMLLKGTSCEHWKQLNCCPSSFEDQVKFILDHSPLIIYCYKLWTNGTVWIVNILISSLYFEIILFFCCLHFSVIPILINSCNNY